jgi:hypothetical protein
LSSTCASGGSAGVDKGRVAAAGAVGADGAVGTAEAARNRTAALLVNGAVGCPAKVCATGAESSKPHTTQIRRCIARCSKVPYRAASLGQNYGHVTRLLDVLCELHSYYVVSKPALPRGVNRLYIIHTVDQSIAQC